MTLLANGVAFFTPKETWHGRATIQATIFNSLGLGDLFL